MNHRGLTRFFGVLAFACSTLFVIGDEFHFKNAPLDTVIDMLGRQAGHNFMMSPKWTGSFAANGNPIEKPVVNFQGEAVPAELLAKILK